VWPYLTVSAYDNSAVLPDDQMWAIVKFIEVGRCRLTVLLTASARLIVISTFSDRRFFVWAKWGGVP
jgi:hypothetical protein